MIARPGGRLLEGQVSLPIVYLAKDAAEQLASGQWVVLNDLRVEKLVCETLGQKARYGSKHDGDDRPRAQSRDGDRQNQDHAIFDSGKWSPIDWLRARLEGAV